MTAPRSRSALWAPLLALLAVLSMIALSGWHGASFHDDDRIHTTWIQHSPTDDARNDPDSVVHLAAHAIGHGIAVPANAVSRTLPAPRVIAWAEGATTVRPGLDPASLLRPPRG